VGGLRIAAVDRFEATQFAAYPEAALRGSAWEVVSSDSKPRHVLPLPGVQVFATPDNDSQDAATFLSDTLLDLGILCCHYNANGSSEYNLTGTKAAGPRVSTTPMKKRSSWWSMRRRRPSPCCRRKAPTEPAPLRHGCRPGLRRNPQYLP
jgi:hypothetical protein